MTSFRSVVASEENAIAPFVCPICKGSLAWHCNTTMGGTVTREAVCCTECHRRYPAVDGTVDFVSPAEDRAGERKYYDHKYDPNGPRPLHDKLDCERWARRWHDPHWPECQIILERLGDLTGKLVLCVGNGSSVKELYFLHLGARLIHSDLSLNGVLKAKATYDLSEYRGRVAFHAIDAYTIPLPDSTVDVLYGFECVHHLPDVGALLREAHRVLRPGGMCVFYDGAYSPLWHWAKHTVLWPLMKLSHLLHKRSPEDLRATHAAGYREEELTRIALRSGFTKPFFRRITLFRHIAIQAVGTMIGWDGPKWCYRVPGWLGRLLDCLLTQRVGLLARSQIDMVWSIDKPGKENAPS